MTDSGGPSLVRSDAWLLASLTQSRGRWQRIDAVIENGEWLNSSILTFDEISYGLPRLVAAGYAEVSKDRSGRLIAAATPRCGKVRARVIRHAKSQHEALAMFHAELGCLPYPQPEVVDRSLGPLPDFELNEYDAALAKYRASEAFAVGLKRAADRILRKR